MKKERRPTTRRSRNPAIAGSLFTRTIRESRVYLTEVVYTSDSVVCGRREFIDDTILVKESTIAPHLQRFDYYTEKGKYRFGRATELDAAGRKTATYSYDKRRRERTRTLIAFNENGLVTTISFQRKGKKYSEELFEYTF